jgi:hypothetical protein
MSPLLHQMSGQTWKASRACLDLIGSVLGSVLGSVQIYVDFMSLRIYIYMYIYTPNLHTYPWRIYIYIYVYIYAKSTYISM